METKGPGPGGSDYRYLNRANRALVADIVPVFNIFLKNIHLFQTEEQALIISLQKRVLASVKTDLRQKQAEEDIKFFLKVEQDLKDKGLI